MELWRETVEKFQKSGKQTIRYHQSQISPRTVRKPQVSFLQTTVNPFHYFLPSITYHLTAAHMPTCENIKILKSVKCNILFGDIFDSRPNPRRAQVTVNCQLLHESFDNDIYHLPVTARVSIHQQLSVIPGYEGMTKVLLYNVTILNHQPLYRSPLNGPHCVNSDRPSAFETVLKFIQNALGKVSEILQVQSTPR